MLTTGLWLTTWLRLSGLRLSGLWLSGLWHTADFHTGQELKTGSKTAAWVWLCWDWSWPNSRRWSWTNYWRWQYWTRIWLSRRWCWHGAATRIGCWRRIWESWPWQRWKRKYPRARSIGVLRGRSPRWRR